MARRDSRSGPGSARASGAAATSRGAGQLNFLSVLTGSFATPAAENPTVAMVEAAYLHHGLDARYRVPETSDIVVNATSIGLHPDVEGRPDLDPDSLRPGMVVADVIPNPPRTLLIQEGEARGCTVLDGLGMLVNQGAISVRHWTGIDAARR